jgi:hypothetical protein
VLAVPRPMWQGTRRPRAIVSFPCRFDRPACCGSSVVEHSLGKGEVESSILSRSTRKKLMKYRLFSLSR